MSGSGDVSCNKNLLNVLIAFFWYLDFTTKSHTCTAVLNRALKEIQSTSRHLLRERFMLLHYTALLFHAEAFYQWLWFFFALMARLQIRRELLFPEMVSPSWRWSAPTALNIWSCYFSSKWENTLPAPTARSLDKAKKKKWGGGDKRRETHEGKRAVWLYASGDKRVWKLKSKLTRRACDSSRGTESGRMFSKVHTSACSWCRSSSCEPSQRPWMCLRSTVGRSPAECVRCTALDQLFTAPPQSPSGKSHQVSWELNKPRIKSTLT